MVQQVHQYRVTLCRLCRKDLSFEICDLASFSAAVCHQQNHQCIYLTVTMSRRRGKRNCRGWWIKIEYQVGPRPPLTAIDPGFGFRLLRQTIYFCQIQPWNFPYIMSAQKPSRDTTERWCLGSHLAISSCKFHEKSSSWRTRQLLLNMLAWRIAPSVCAKSNCECYWHREMPFTYLQQVIASVLSCNISKYKYTYP